MLGSTHTETNGGMQSIQGAPGSSMFSRVNLCEQEALRWIATQDLIIHSAARGSARTITEIHPLHAGLGDARAFTFNDPQPHQLSCSAFFKLERCIQIHPPRVCLGAPFNFQSRPISNGAKAMVACLRAADRIGWEVVQQTSKLADSTHSAHSNSCGDNYYHSSCSCSFTMEGLEICTVRVAISQMARRRAKGSVTNRDLRARKVVVSDKLIFCKCRGYDTDLRQTSGSMERVGSRATLWIGVEK